MGIAEAETVLFFISHYALLKELIRRPPPRPEFYSYFDWLKPTNGRITDLSRIASFFRNAWLLLGPSGGHFHCCSKPHPRASFLVWVVGWWSLGGQKHFFLGGGLHSLATTSFRLFWHFGTHQRAEVGETQLGRCGKDQSLMRQVSKSWTFDVCRISHAGELSLAQLIKLTMIVARN